MVLDFACPETLAENEGVCWPHLHGGGLHAGRVVAQAGHEQAQLLLQAQRAALLRQHLRHLQPPPAPAQRSACTTRLTALLIIGPRSTLQPPIPGRLLLIILSEVCSMCILHASRPHVLHSAQQHSSRF